MASPSLRLTRDEPERFAAALNMLAAATHTTIDDPHYDAQWVVLQDLPIAAVEEAARVLLTRDSPFLPSAGQWFSRALALADAQWAEGMRLPTPTTQQVEGDAAEGLTSAKDAFFTQLSTFIGQERAAQLKAQTRQEVPTYLCATCADTGWADAPPDPRDRQLVGYVATRIRRCQCWAARRAAAGAAPARCEVL
jgi:hypothetical protein